MTTINEAPQKCVTYSRVSTVRQKTDRQIDDLSTWADKNNKEIVESFEEQVSGKKKDRPAFTKMLEYVKDNDIKLIVCSELSRFGRSITDVLLNIKELDQIGVEVYFIDRNSSTKDKGSKVNITLLALMADIESEFILERTLSGKEKALREGKRMATPVLTFGYQVDPVTKKHIKHPYEAKKVEEIYDMWINQNMSLRSIADKLDKDGVPTKKTSHKNYWKRGKKPEWRLNNVTKILRNPVYKGENSFTIKRRDDNRVIKETKTFTFSVPYIIEPEIWDMAQSKFKPALEGGDSRLRELHLSKKQREEKDYDNNKYLFRGKIICGRCGIHYGSRTEKRDDKPNWQPQSCYYCFTRKHPVKTKRCMNGQFNSTFLDDALWYLLTANERFIETRLKEEIDKFDFEGTERRIQVLKSENIELQKDNDKLIDLFQINTLNVNEIKKRSAELYARIRKNKDIIEELELLVKENKRKLNLVNNQYSEAVNKRDMIFAQTKEATPGGDRMFANIFLPDLKTNRNGDIKKKEYVEKYVKEIRVWHVKQLNFNFEDLPRQIYDLNLTKKNKPLYKVSDSVVYAEMIAFDENIKLKCVMSTYSKNFYASDNLLFKENKKKPDLSTLEII